MKTSQLIDALAADPKPQGPSLSARFCVALGAGALVSACLFLAIAGPRSDIAAAAHTLRFDLKFVDTLALALRPRFWPCGCCVPTLVRALLHWFSQRRFCCWAPPWSWN